MADATAAATGSSQNPKRLHSDSEESDDMELKRLRQEETTEKWYRFLIISSETNEKIKASPFAIKKTIESYAGTPNSVKHLRSGDILVETKSSKQSSQVGKINKILDHPVTVSPHRSLNYSKAVVFCPDLKGESDSIILKELAEQEVCEVKKLGKAGTILLTFAKPNHPAYVNIGYIRCKCNTYVPNPTRCFQCQKLGHVSSVCKGNPTCAKCGQEGHSTDSCSDDPICVNCSGPHLASDKNCPAWVKEKHVLKIKTVQKVSIGQARRLYNDSLPPVNSFARVASSQKKPEMAEMATQTEEILAISLIKDLIKTADFRSAVLEIVASVVPNVSEPMHVSVENDVSTNVNVCKSADCSPSREDDAMAAKSVSVASQKKTVNANKAKQSSEHTMVVTATDRVQNSQHRSSNQSSLSHNTDRKIIKKFVRNRTGANSAHNGRHSTA